MTKTPHPTAMQILDAVLAGAYTPAQLKQIGNLMLVQAGHTAGTLPPSDPDFDPQHETPAHYDARLRAIKAKLRVGVTRVIVDHRIFRNVPPGLTGTVEQINRRRAGVRIDVGEPRWSGQLLMVPIGHLIVADVQDSLLAVTDLPRNGQA